MNKHYKKSVITLLSSFLLLVSVSTFAQKSIYDVIPGSGPKNKKTETVRKPGSGHPDIINGNNKRHNDRRVYRRNRRHLPPGQAKKIYGGSAKDYAPGQRKKPHSKNWGKGKHHGHE